MMTAFSALMLFLGVAGLVGLHWYVSTESFKLKVARAVKARTGYDLVMEGDIGVTLYPWIGIATGPAALLKPGEPEPLISVQRASAGVRLLPLISGQVDLDVIVLEDMAALVVRTEDGQTNWDDLIRALTPTEDKTEAQDGGSPAMTMRGVQIENGSLTYLDEAAGRSWTVAGLNTRTGVLEQGQAVAVSLEAQVASPDQEIEGKVTVTGSVQVDFSTGDLRLHEGRMDAEFRYPLIKEEGDPVRVTATVDLDSSTEELLLDNLYAQAAGLDLTGRVLVTGILSEPVAKGHVETRVFAPRDFLNALSPGMIPPDDPGIFREGRVTTDFTFDGTSLGVNELDLRMDDSHLTGNLDLPMDDNGTLGFNLVVDNLDFDRYYRLYITPEDFILADFFPEFVCTWRAEGTLNLANTILAGEEVSELVLRLTCFDGLMAVTVGQARVMGGGMTGDGSIKVASAGKGYKVSLAARGSVVGAQAGRLPLGSGEDHLLTGQGDMNFSFEVTDKVMALDQIIDDLLRDARLTLGCSLGPGDLVTLEEDEGGGDQVLSWDQAKLNLALTGNGRGVVHDDFQYQAGVVLKLNGPAWNATTKLTGDLALDFPLESLRLGKADLGLQYHGAPLPTADPVAVLSAVVDLDTAKDTALFSDIRLEAVDAVLTGRLTGSNALSQGYSYGGSVRLSSPDPTRTLALLRDENTVNTADPEALKILTGQADVLVAGDNIDLVNLVLTLDQTEFTGRARIKELGSGRVAFNLRGGALDLDRYREPRAEKKEEQHTEDCSAGSGKPPTPLPLDTLRDLDLEGSLSLDLLKIYGFRFQNLSLAMDAGNGMISVTPLGSDFYGGKMDGSLGVSVIRDSLSMNLNLDAVNFKAEDFLGDQFERDYVRGLSELHFHLKTVGATNDELIESQSGTAGFVIRDGSYKFLGASKAGEEEPAQPEQDNAMASPNAPKSNRTAFSLARADFKVFNGRYEVQDFQLKALAMSATGGGNFDMAKNTIDLAINADFVAAPDVPIYIEGCLSDPDVSVPGDEILQNAVEDIISIPLRPFQFLRDNLF